MPNLWISYPSTDDSRKKVKLRSIITLPEQVIESLTCFLPFSYALGAHGTIYASITSVINAHLNFMPHAFILDSTPSTALFSLSPNIHSTDQS